MRICIYEDRRVADLFPLTLTRPATDLLCGLTTLGQKHTRHFGPDVVGYLCRSTLADWLRAREPRSPVNDPTWLRSAPTVLVNARWLPPHESVSAPRELFAAGPFLGTVGGEVAFAVLDQKRLLALAPSTIDDCLGDWLQTLPRHDVGGTVIRHAWELLDHNGAELAHDVETMYDPADAGCPPAGFGLVGHADQLFIHPEASVEPMVVADTTRGPVVIGPGAVVSAFTRLEGPCAIGPHTHLLSAKVRGGTTIGPHCRVGGSVECSVLLGYTNKAHDGFLGHSYVGEWVNLAAGTTTADLRFDYEPVSVPVGGSEVPSGRTKLGSLIGDHTKTGLGVLLDCGTATGAFSQLLPTGALAPRSIPSFHRSGPRGLKALDAHPLIETAGVVMRRRGRSLSRQLEAVYRALAGAPAMETPVTLPLRRSA
jgi:UDP-N-acetylglucosamine diphosphorylase/glucosamine-1-phosphate N-acetyltransferase